MDVFIGETLDTFNLFANQKLIKFHILVKNQSQRFTKILAPYSPESKLAINAFDFIVFILLREWIVDIHLILQRIAFVA